MDDLRRLTDAEVLSRMDELASHERDAVADALACLAEVDRRKCYASLGYSDLFEYAVAHLKYSRGAAYRRVHAARAAERYLELYQDLREGTIPLSIVALLDDHLSGGKTDQETIAGCRGKTSRQAEEWLASRQSPAPPVPDRVRVRPPMPNAQEDLLSAMSGAQGQGPSALAPRPQPTYEHTFTASARLHRALERLKEVLASKYPLGSLGEVLTEAVEDYLSRHDPSLNLAEELPEAAKDAVSTTRHIPRAVRDAVWSRDGGRCTFVSAGGRRCECRRALQIDHIIPFSEGGKTTLSNLRLLCPEHNQLERRRKLGEDRRAHGEARRASLKLLKEESAQLPLPS